MWYPSCKGQNVPHSAWAWPYWGTKTPPGYESYAKRGLLCPRAKLCMVYWRTSQIKYVRNRNICRSGRIFTVRTPSGRSPSFFLPKPVIDSIAIPSENITQCYEGWKHMSGDILVRGQSWPTLFQKLGKLPGSVVCCWLESRGWVQLKSVFHQIIG